MSSFVKKISCKLADFFDTGLQRFHYRFFFIKIIKKRTADKIYKINKGFEKKAKKFYAPYVKNICTRWHSYYASCNGIYDVKYIPENLYYSKVEPHYNKISFAKAIDDKNYYNILFGDNINKPETIIKNISGVYTDKRFTHLTKDKAADLCLDKKAFVVKPSIDGRGGNRITFIQSEETTKDELLKLFDKYGSNFIAEKLIKQSDEMSYFNPTSVNTVRFITFMHDGKVLVLSAVLRIGGEGARTDNFSTGGISCGIDENGITKTNAYDQNYNLHTVTADGIEFGNHKISNFAEGRDLVLSLHRRFPHFKILSWDIAFDENNKALLIEFNITPQGVDLHQINNGPLFGNATEEVLEEVFGKR